MPLRCLLRVCQFAALAMFVGCGSDASGRVGVSGTVKLNGAPLPNGSIEFSPVGGTGVQSGSRIEAGKYSIPREQGLTAGEYRVAIIDSPPASPLPPGHMPGDPLPPAPKPQVPADWNAQSQHKVTLAPKGSQTFDFDIQTKK